MSVASQHRQPVPDDPVLDRLCAEHDTTSVNEALAVACRAFASRHGAERLPLRLDLLLRGLGARREARHLAGDGRLEMDDDGHFVVVVDAGQHWARQRFTTAHEFAHVILFSEFADDPEALRRLRSPELWNVVERACNAAAAELLMPTDDVSATVGKVGLDPSGLSELHSRYAVSWSALLVRLSEVLQVPVAVFRRHARHSDEPEQWRVHRFYGAAHGVWLPTGITTRHLSAPVIEQSAIDGFAHADVVIDEPTPTRARVLATSLAHARKVPRQEGLFDELPPEPSRWPEVAAFLVPASSSPTHAALARGPSSSSIDAGRGSHAVDTESRTLSLW